MIKQLKVNPTLIQQAIDLIKARIVHKLDTARKLLEYDKEIAAGIFTYAIEELGKLEVLKKASFEDGQYLVNYKDQFMDHDAKFEAAFKYLDKVGHSGCVNIGGTFTEKSFSNSSFTLDLLPETEARLGIFYADFDYDKVAANATKVKDIPFVNESKLKTAIDEVEDVLDNWS